MKAALALHIKENPEYIEFILLGIVPIVDGPQIFYTIVESFGSIAVQHCDPEV